MWLGRHHLFAEIDVALAFGFPCDRMTRSHIPCFDHSTYTCDTCVRYVMYKCACALSLQNTIYIYKYIWKQWSSARNDRSNTKNQTCCTVTGTPNPMMPRFSDLTETLGKHVFRKRIRDGDWNARSGCCSRCLLVPF